MIALTAMLSLYACKGTQKAGKWKAPKDSFVFIEYYTTQEGKVMIGQVFPGRQIHGPTYTYSAESKEISSIGEYPFSIDTMQILVGKGLILRGSVGGGMHSELMPYASLPVVEDNFEVVGLTRKGMHIIWKGEPITLPIGERWTTTETALDTLVMPNGKTISEITTTYSVVYHGVMPKEKLIFK